MYMYMHVHMMYTQYRKKYVGVIHCFCYCISELDWLLCPNRIGRQALFDKAPKPALALLLILDLAEHSNAQHSKVQ